MNTPKKKTWFCKIEEKEVGPLDAARIKKLIAAGTLKAEHHVRKENGKWQPVSTIPKLKQLLDLIQNSLDREEPEETRPAWVAYEQYFPKFARVRLCVAVFAFLLAGLLYALRTSGLIFEPPNPTMLMKRLWLLRAFLVGLAPAMAVAGLYTSMTALYLLKAPKDWFTKSEHGKSWIDVSRFRRDNVAGFKMATAAVGLFGLLCVVGGFGNVCVSFW